MGQKLTVDEAAAALRISRRGVRNMISSGELPAYRVGKTVSVRVDADDLAALLTPVLPGGKTAVVSSKTDTRKT